MLTLLAAALPLVAVLEFRNDVPGIDAKTNRDGSYLADVARTAAVEAGLRVMTRENVVVLLEANHRSLADCVGKCEIETARLLGASYVVTGALLQFGGQLRLSLRLHDTAQGTLLMGSTVAGGDVGAIESGTPEAAKRLLKPLLGAPAGDEDEAQTLAAKARQLLGARQFAAAAETAQRALQSQPKSPKTLHDAHQALGYAHAYLGHPDTAKDLTEYLPYCDEDCGDVRQFLVKSLRPPPRIESIDVQPSVVRANVRGDSPIAMVRLQSKKRGSDWYDIVTMEPVGNDVYEAPRPKGDVELFVIAMDKMGVIARRAVKAP